MRPYRRYTECFPDQAGDSIKNRWGNNCRTCFIPHLTLPCRGEDKGNSYSSDDPKAEMSDEQFERRNVLVSGRVQGVGFRYTTRTIASQYEATGFVQNLPDGRVRLTAEGSPVELDRFFDEIKRVMQNNIDDFMVDVGSANSEFQDFSIRY